MHEPAGIISDVDGVLWIADRPAPGAPELIADLVDAGHPCVLLTNDCSVSEQARTAALLAAGFPPSGWSLISAAGLVQKYLVDEGISRVVAFGAPGAFVPEQVEVTRDPEAAEAVIVGDCFQQFDAADIGIALAALDRGIPFLAAQRNRRWSDGVQHFPDNGFFVAGLEYCAGRQATTLGKPDPASYLTALQSVGREPAQTIFISDSDEEIHGAVALGFRTYHVTGPSGIGEIRSLLIG